MSRRSATAAAAATDEAPDLLSRTPIETSISEGNLAENPIFVLNASDAKPLRAGIDEKTGNKIRYPDKNDYKRTIELGTTEVNGRTCVKTLDIAAHQEFGYPTMFAYRLLLIVIDEAQRQGLQSPVVYINRHQLARRLGYKTLGKSLYEDIDNAFRALRSVQLEFRNAWYDKEGKGRVGQLKCTGLISEFTWDEEKQLEIPLPGEDADGVAKRNWVQLSSPLYKSLKDKYFSGIDLEYLNSLGSPLAQRLYAYLTKKNHERSEYSEGLKSLGVKLNLKKKAPSAIRDSLEPALELLMSAVKLDKGKPGQAVKPRRFLKGYSIDPEKQMVTVRFFDPTGEQVRQSLADARTRQALFPGT